MGAVRSKSFPSQPESARAARHWIEAAAADVNWTGSVDELQLLVSELVTNALQHAQAGVRVTLLSTGTGMWVSVKDAGSGEVVMRHAEPTDTNGRGLEIVDRVSEAWGVLPEAEGKAVWFEALPQDPPLRLPASSEPAPAGTR